MQCTTLAMPLSGCGPAMIGHCWRCRPPALRAGTMGLQGRSGAQLTPADWVQVVIVAGIGSVLEW